MATLSAPVVGSMASDADFRVNCQFVFDALSLGFVQTADTGQLNPATVTRPVAINTDAGYLLFRFNDALQATVPVFLKFYLGTGSAVTAFRIRFEIGTATDGSGNLAGVLLVAAQTLNALSANAAATLADASGAASRLVFAMFMEPSGGQIRKLFAIERTKSSTGADTADGLLLTWGGGTATGKLERSLYAPFTGVVPTIETGINFILSTNNPSSYGADVGLGLVVPLLGFARQPGMNWLLAQPNDFTPGGTITMQLYGATRTFKVAGDANSLTQPITTIGSGALSVRLLLRWE